MSSPVFKRKTIDITVEGLMAAIVNKTKQQTALPFLQHFCCLKVTFFLNVLLMFVCVQVYICACECMCVFCMSHSNPGVFL